MSEQTPSPPCNPVEIERGLKLLHGSGDVFEVRLLKCKPRGWKGKAFTSAGWFDDPAKAAAAVAAVDVHLLPAGCYVTLNSCDSQLLARGPNELREHAEETTNDNQITGRRRLLLDFDPDRVAGIASTQVELDAAYERAKAVREWLEHTHGWPDPIRALSGNGPHLVYGYDLPNDEASTLLTKAVLVAINTKFGDEIVAGKPVTGKVGVDLKVFNASRITKLYGTVARKGANTPERPHRLSRILAHPDVLVPVPIEKLQAVAALAPVEPRKASGGNGQVKHAAPAGRDGASSFAERLRAVMTKDKVIEFFGKNGVTDLKSSGADGWLRGHLHHESHHDGAGDPAFGVHPGTASWCDHRAGEKTGGLVEFLTTYRGLDKKAAGKAVAEFFGVKDDGRRAAIDVSTLGAADIGDAAIVERAHARRKHPLRRPLTDLGNAELFVALHGEDVRFVHPWRRWLVWDGARWAEDLEGRAHLLASDVSAALYREAARLASEAALPEDEEMQPAGESKEEGHA